MPHSQTRMQYCPTLTASSVQVNLSTCELQKDNLLSNTWVRKSTDSNHRLLKKEQELEVCISSSLCGQSHSQEPYGVYWGARKIENKQVKASTQGAKKEFQNKVKDSSGKELIQIKAKINEIGKKVKGASSIKWKGRFKGERNREHK